MQAEEVVARAARDVAARRLSAVEQRWNGPRQWTLPLLVLIVLAGFVGAPGTMPDKLLWIMGGVCSLRPAHSYFAGSLPLPLEARMVGIYGGSMITVVILLIRARSSAGTTGSVATTSLLVGMFMLMVADGINSTLMELGWPHLYTTTNALRLITGLLSGIALAFGLVAVLTRVLQTPARSRSAKRSAAATTLAFALAANAGFAGLVMQEWGWLYYPLAIISVAGIVTILTGVSLMIVATVSGSDGYLVRLRLLVAPTSLAVLIALTVLAGTASVRWLMSAPM